MISSAFIGGLFGSLIGIMGIFIGIFLKETVSQAVHKRKVAAVLEAYLDFYYSYIYRLNNGPLLLSYATQWQNKVKAAMHDNTIADVQKEYMQLLNKFEEGFMQLDAVREFKDSMAKWDAFERRRILKDINAAIDNLSQDKLFPNDRDIAVMPVSYVKTFIQFKLGLSSFLRSADCLVRNYDDAVVGEEKLGKYLATCVLSLFDSLRYLNDLLNDAREIRDSSLVKLALSRR